MTTMPAIYFSTLEIENVRCFEGRQELDLRVDDRPAQWSLIIGENGAGKTTLLECLIWMCPVPELSDSPLSTLGTGEISPLTDGLLKPALPGADDEVLETLPRDASAEVKLGARLEFGGERFSRSTEAERATSQWPYISVGMNVSFDEHGQLHNLDLTESTQVRSLVKPYHDPLIVAYGANRQLGDRNLIGFDELDPLDY